MSHPQSHITLSYTEFQQNSDNQHINYCDLTIFNMATVTTLTTTVVAVVLGIG